MIQNYLMIENNLVVNVCPWDGNPSTWTPPADSLMLAQATTPAMVWVWQSDQNDYVISQEIGSGQIGYTWNGTYLTTNQPKPEPIIPVADQPTTSGTQTL